MTRIEETQLDRIERKLDEILAFRDAALRLLMPRMPAPARKAALAALMARRDAP